MKKSKKTATFTIAAVLTWAVLIPTVQAETTPSSEDMIADALLARPVAAVASILGMIGYVVTYPFSAAGGNTKQVKEKLVSEPVENLWGRPLGQPPVSIADQFFQDED